MAPTELRFEGTKDMSRRSADLQTTQWESGVWTKEQMGECESVMPKRDGREIRC